MESDIKSPSRALRYVPVAGFLLFVVVLSLFSYFAYNSFSKLLSNIRANEQSSDFGYVNEYVRHIQSAKTFWGIGDSKRVIEEGESALGISRTNEEKSGAHYWIGIGYYMSGNLDTAQQHEETAISLDPGFAGPYVTLGAVMIDKGDLTKAKELAKKAIELDPDFAWGYNLLAIVLNEEGDKEEAIIHMNKAISLNPSSEIFKQNLRLIEGEAE